MKDNNMNIKSKSKHIILTGAGFSKNFGGLLAKEMWYEIFNHKRIQAQLKIKELMMEDSDFDYEKIYTSIMEGSYKNDVKEDIDYVLRSAYKNIDDTLREYSNGNPHPVELTNLLELFYRLAGQNNKSFIFTLNQDMFFERLFSFSVNKPCIPGIENNPEWFTSYYRKELGEADYCNLPDCLKLNRINPDLLSHRNLFIIKLHGSCNWIKSDGTPGMIIGRGKNEQIQKEPLLKYYFEVFKETLSHCQRRLLIIGYGFGDDHINQIIAESVRNYRLKIYIISPDSMPDFRKKILDRNKLGIDILDGISGYFPYNLMEIFPEDYKQTQQKINLFESFFE